MGEYILTIAIFGAIYGLLGLSLNLQWGHTGLANFGYLAYFAVGAYATAILVTRGVPFPLAFLVSIAVAALFALPIGWLTLGLADDYFAIVSMGFAVTTLIVLENWEFVGESNGIFGIPSLFSGLPSDWGLWMYFGMFAACIGLVIVGLHLLVQSPYGRMLRAVKSNPDAVTALGKDPRRFRQSALLLSAGCLGAVGSLYACYVGYVAPSQFDFGLAFAVYTGVVLGGSSNLGALSGVVLLLVLTESTRFIPPDVVPLNTSQFAQVRVLISGVILIVIMKIRPDGLLPQKIRQRKVDVT